MASQHSTHPEHSQGTQFPLIHSLSAGQGTPSQHSTQSGQGHCVVVIDGSSVVTGGASVVVAAGLHSI